MKRLIFIGILLVIGYFIYQAIKIVNNVNPAEVELLKINNTSDTPTFKMTGNDSLILNKAELNYFDVFKIENSSKRKPVSFLGYRDKYMLVIFRLPSGLTSLNQVQFDSTRIIDLTSGLAYRDLNENIYIDFHYRLNAIPKINVLYLLNEKGSITKVERNSTSVYFTARTPKFGIEYDKNGPIDLLLKQKNSSLFRKRNISLQGLLFKVESDYYFTVLVPLFEDGNLPDGLIKSAIDSAQFQLK